MQQRDLCSIVFYYALLCFYHCILRIDLLIYSAPQLQECLINLLTYLLTYLRSRSIGPPRVGRDPGNSLDCGPAAVGFQYFAPVAYSLFSVLEVTDGYNVANPLTAIKVNSSQCLYRIEALITLKTFSKTIIVRATFSSTTFKSDNIFRS